MKPIDVVKRERDEALSRIQKLEAENTQLAAAFHRLYLCIPLPLATADEIKAGNVDAALLNTIERQLRAFHEMREKKPSTALHDLLAPTIGLLERVEPHFEHQRFLMTAEAARLRAVTGGEK